MCALQEQFLGIDIGSVSVTVVLVDSDGAMSNSWYQPHDGARLECLRSILSQLPPGLRCYATTTSSSPPIPDAGRVDQNVAYLAAASRLCPEANTILYVGGEQFGAIRLDTEGAFLGLTANSSCAAGTGSFLDQQSHRLGLSGAAELAERAGQNDSEIPTIASRCSVFAKTDIIHAQQEGFSLPEICDGLCFGLARNVADTVFSTRPPDPPVLIAGGVSQNVAVVEHLKDYIGCPVLVHEYSHLLGAIGCCFTTIGENGGRSDPVSRTVSQIIESIEAAEDSPTAFFGRLELLRSDYPDFDDHRQYRAETERLGPKNPVEVDVYQELGAGPLEIYLGFDIGSTSTKAVMLRPEGTVTTGLYTRTAGRPLPAVQGILEAIDRLIPPDAELRILGVGTTGSGRKFTGALVGADLVLDEISAHARAAYELDPATDTIIEIGGQDSKFTSMKDGMVTFSQMNTVCAAGTGSFVEEQAEKLGVPLSEFSRRALGSKAPLTSDRCTVFMERDLNLYLRRNHSIDELLAATVCAVRENYLLKVAAQASIGTTICFQGATAKNAALVAAFEQGLGKPIKVSRYCHLTGALGVALVLADEGVKTSSFRGIDIHRHEIPIETEICALCRNHCRIRLATVAGERVAYGFLCGRDYTDHRRVSKNSSGFSLVREWRRTFHADGAVSGHPVFGVPAALHMFEEQALWVKFFNELGISVTTSADFDHAMVEGKKEAGAEFCAPIAEFHGHCTHLAGEAEYVFAPMYLEPRELPEDRLRTGTYCYYTQYAPSLARQTLARQGHAAHRLVCPVFDPRRGADRMKRKLFASLEPMLRDLPGNHSYFSVARAFDAAVAHYRECRSAWVRRFAEGSATRAPVIQGSQEVEVALLGRPYAVLSPSMNKRIPEIFAGLGVKAWYQDMLPLAENLPDDYLSLVRTLHWNFSARIADAAAFCAETKGLYPVLVTCFKCTPDSFTIEYFKRIMDRAEKPYLILQLDEHGSNVGYETRIEAGLRSFRNHHRLPGDKLEGAGSNASQRSVMPEITTEIQGKTVLYPAFDDITAPLLVANLRRSGLDVRLLEENETAIRQSMRHNTGQCIPLNIIAQEFANYLRDHDLDPKQTVLWMLRGKASCSIGMYPYYIRTLLEDFGGDCAAAGVYVGEVSHLELSPIVAIRTYCAYLLGGLLRRLGCRIRPYETDPGATDQAVRTGQRILIRAFRGGRGLTGAVEEVLDLFDTIPYRPGSRPEVAIFGDLYVRDNAVMNQDLIHSIEAAGGEVVTTPYNEYLKIVSAAYFQRWIKDGQFRRFAVYRVLLAVVDLIERRLSRHFPEGMAPSFRPKSRTVEEDLSRFDLTLFHEGESSDNVLKILHVLREHPNLSLFVQASPAFCCPSLVTEAMGADIERVTGVPVVTITYDGTGVPKNEIVIPYLKGSRVPAQG